jgi:5-methyltetrahydropteroyltriglutamate--homocysteine methyltransferase
MTLPVLPTTVVGSYPQPDWLVDRALLSKGVPRVRQQAIWRIPEPLLEQAQDDATIVAIREIERAGIDIVSDGEIRRESYSNRFATALDGVDIAQPALITDRYGNQTAVPRVVGRVRRTRPVELRDMQFLRRHTDHPAKITLPGPFTMTQQARNEFYRDVESLAMDFAAAVNAEARELEAAGADLIQLDEPWLRNDPEGAKRYAVPAINRALEGLRVPTALHLCFGYAAVVKHQKPTGYSFLPQLAATTAQQISIEAAQARPGGAERPGRQDHHPGRDRSGRPRDRDGGPGGRADPGRTRPGARRAAGGRARLRDEVPAARDRLRQAARAGRRRPRGARPDRLTRPRLS